MSNDARLHTWDYWRGKYGRAEALSAYFPDLAKTDPVLAYALAQYEAAKLAIDARMTQLADADPDKGW